MRNSSPCVNIIKTLEKNGYKLESEFEPIITLLDFNDIIVLDLEQSMQRDEFFSLVSEVLSKRLEIDKKKINDLLIKREEQTTTVIEKGLALPHIVEEGTKKFEVVMVRSKGGIIFAPDKEPVHIVFILAGSSDERNFHLRALMAIAQIVREPNFYKNWMWMRDEESLRMLVLSSTRKREI